MTIAETDTGGREVDRPACVLLAEDDEAMRGFVATALARDGYRVIEIENGTDLHSSLTRLAGTPPKSREIDIVVSDIHMPGKTALEVLAEFRQMADEVPIVLVTAFGSAKTHAEAKSLGAAAVLDKPFDLAELRALLRELAPAPRRPARACAS